MIPKRLGPRRFAAFWPALLPIVGSCLHVEAAEALAPESPACEYAKNPLGIDVRAPRFSWRVNDSRRGAVQSAYRILVSDDGAALSRDEGSAWDSGKVSSDRSIQVVYAGKPVAARKTYFWKVRTWDGADAASPWSEVAHFEMGLLSPADWLARWISSGGGGEAKDDSIWGKWIWNRAAGENARVFFRSHVDLSPLGESPKIDEAVLKITADDGFELHVNGVKVGSGGAWNTVFRFDLKEHLKAGKNILSISVNNGTGPGALIAGLHARSGEKVVDVLSNDSWLSSLSGPEGWTKAEFDDKSWEKASVVAEYGDMPWGKIKEKARPRRSLSFRRELELNKTVARARVYSSGLGLYQLSINGKRVGNDIFAPGWTHYPKRIQYQTYDVTSLLKPGANAVGAVLGNGWWSGGLGWNQGFTYSDGNLRLILQLEVDYADGSQERLVTDGSWKSHPSPVVEDSFYHGEAYDARLEMPGWDQAGFDEKEWARAIVLPDRVDLLVAEKCEPIRVTKEVACKKVARLPAGAYVLDFGQNFAGRVRMKVKGRRGTEVKLRFAEVLNPDGSVYTANYRSARATDTYVLRGDGEGEEWEPAFTYRGFRYVELSGYPGEPQPEAFTGLVLHTDAAFAGKFQCSNDLLNRIQENITWGQRSNLHSVPTDCPQRDERLGWMGDTQAFGPTACLNMNLAPFFTKWMRDIADSQAPDGAVTDVAPVAVVSGPAAPAWGDAVVIVPWTVYERYGDRRIIEENYAAMKAWVEYMRKHAPNHLYEREGYGDWVAPVNSPKKPIGAAYYYRSTKLFSRMAAVLGHADDAREYGELSQKIADAFNAKYFDSKSAAYEGGTQTANLLPLEFGIVPRDRQKDVLASVVKDITARDYHLSTGFLGTACLMQVLSQGGAEDVAYKVATQRTYPSWGYMVEKGATTIWELWNSDTQGPEMNSRNHFAFGVVGQWFYEELAGIHPDPEAPGYKRTIIRPRPAGDLEWARAEYQSAHGPIQSAWRKGGGIFTLEVSLPANTSALVHVPLPAGGAPTVLEGEKVVFKDGKPAEKVDGVKFSRVEGGSAVFDVGSGHYSFQVKA